MTSKFFVVEEMPCPKCRGTGTIHISRDLDSLWEELSEHISTDDGETLITRLEVRRDCEPGNPPTAELLALLDVLRRRDK